MGAELVADPEGVAVTVTDERWEHIVQGHRERAPHRDDLAETIRAPNAVYEKDGDRYYFGRVQSRRYGRVYLHARAIASPNYFVVTAWLTPSHRPPQGAVLRWLSLTPP